MKIKYFSAFFPWEKGKYVLGFQIGYEKGDWCPLLVISFFRWMIFIGPHYSQDTK